MGQMVVFPANGGQADGYLAAPAQKGPGVVIIQEWWGLVDHIKDVCDRFADAGYVALAPDLFHGMKTKEPDEAQKLMMGLQMDEASREIKGAFAYLETNPMVEPDKIGCVGFCMGGALSLYMATVTPVAAAVSFYGIPSPEPDYSAIRGAVLGHFAEHDDWANQHAVKETFSKLQGLGIESEYHTYPGTEHAFFNDDRPEVYNREAAELAYSRTLEFFGKHLEG